MNGSLVRFRPVARLAPVLFCLGLGFGDVLNVTAAAPPPTPPPAADAMVDQGARDPRLKGLLVPKGFRVDWVAGEAEVGPGPAALAWDDRGGLLIAGWSVADRWFEVDETIHPAGGGEPVRVRRKRKTTTDVVRHLVDRDGDGECEASEIVLDGVDQPTAISPGKGHLLLAANGRLERWDDTNGDGRYEARTVLLDGFPGSSRRGLGGVTRGLDGWLYLATGDGPGHVVGADGHRVDVEHAGSIFRCRPDGSRLHPFATGLLDPRGGVAFDAAGQPWLVDDDQEDGSKFQGVRLLAPVEDGDYGWRSRPDGGADLDRAAADGERPGKLGPVARLGRGTPGGLAVAAGGTLPREVRGLLLDPDPVRHSVRGLKVDPGKPGQHPAVSETNLITGDKAFRPAALAVGPDGSIYVLDDRGEPTAPTGRIYRLRWVGSADAIAEARPAAKRVVAGATVDALLPVLTGDDPAEAEHSLRELVAKGPDSRRALLGVLADTKQPTPARILALQGARSFWDETVEAAVVLVLGDPSPDLRRLAVQALGWEPRRAEPALVARLAPLFVDPDPRVARDAVLAIGRHAESRPGPTAVILARRLFHDTKIDPTLRDGILRALERLGDAGVEELAVAVRTKRGTDRERAVGFFAALRSPAAAERLPDLVTIPDLTTTERIALVRQYAAFPPAVSLPTQTLADWLARHDEVDPAVKLAVLDACRLGGNPASALVLHLLDDDDEATRMAAVEVAARSRPPGSMARLADRLRRAETSAAERLASMHALGGFGTPALPAIEAAAPKASDDPGYAVARLRALEQADRDKARPALVAELGSTDADLHAEAVRLLARSPEGAVALAKARLAGTIGRDDQPLIQAALLKHRDRPGVRAAADELAKVEAEEGIMKRPDGDPWRGLAVLLRDRPTGGAITVAGPVGAMLADHADWLDAKTLLQALGSSTEKGSTLGFAVTRLRLKDGRTAEGVAVRSDSKGVTLRDAAGTETSHAADTIAARETGTLQIDPVKIGRDLSPGDVGDLLAFVASPAAREAMRAGPRRVERVVAAGPTDGGADRLRAPLAKVDPARLLPGQDGASLPWTALEASEAGTFDLRGQFGNRPGRVYVATEIRGESGAEAALRFSTDGPARVYLNGTRIAGLGEADPDEAAASFRVPRSGTVAPMPGSARLSLKDGWNLVVVALDRPAQSGPARLALEVLSARPVEVRTPPRGAAPAPAVTTAPVPAPAESEIAAPAAVAPSTATARTPTPGRNR